MQGNHVVPQSKPSVVQAFLVKSLKWSEAGPLLRGFYTPSCGPNEQGKQLSHPIAGPTGCCRTSERGELATSRTSSRGVRTAIMGSSEWALHEGNGQRAHDMYRSMDKARIRLLHIVSQSIGHVYSPRQGEWGAQNCSSNTRTSVCAAYLTSL